MQAAIRVTLKRSALAPAATPVNRVCTGLLRQSSQLRTGLAVPAPPLGGPAHRAEPVEKKLPVVGKYANLGRMTGPIPATAPPARAENRKRAEHLGRDRRRPLILDAAFTVFLERGYDGASMEEIARLAGVTKPVVYDSFAGKEELFNALLEREEQRILGQISATLPQDAGGDPERAVAGALTAFLRAVADSADAYRVIFLGQGGGRAAVTERIQRGRMAQVDAIAALTRAWLEDRRAADPDTAARLIAHALVGTAEAAARALLAEPERWDPDTMGPMLAGLIVRGHRGL